MSFTRSRHCVDGEDGEYLGTRLPRCFVTNGAVLGIQYEWQAPLPTGVKGLPVARQRDNLRPRCGARVTSRATEAHRSVNSLLMVWVCRLAQQMVAMMLP
jgi:hypothetical protein